jgi:hypothetical protein
MILRNARGVERKLKYLGMSEQLKNSGKYDKLEG